MRFHGSLKEKGEFADGFCKFNLLLLIFTVMLLWFAEKEVCAVILKDCGKPIEEDEVEVHPEELPDAAIDENVDVHLIRKYFTNDTWLLVKDVLQTKQENPAYIC